MYLNENDFNQIEEYMFNKTRDLELAVYNFLVNQDNYEIVSMALSMYQNRDGGFKCINPDLLDVNSSILQTIEGIKMLYLIKHFDDEAKRMLQKAINYLAKNLTDDNELLAPFNSTYKKYRYDEKIENEDLWISCTLDACYYIFTNTNSQTINNQKAKRKLMHLIDEYLLGNIDSLYVKYFLKLNDLGNTLAYRLEELEKKNISNLSIMQQNVEQWSIDNQLMPINILTGSWIEKFKDIHNKNCEWLVANRNFLGVWNLPDNISSKDDITRIKWDGIITIKYIAILTNKTECN